MIILIMERNDLIHNSKKFTIGLLGIFLLTTLVLGFETAYADNNEIKIIITIRGTYPADSAFFDAVISPPLTNVSKAFFGYHLAIQVRMITVIHGLLGK